MNKRYVTLIECELQANRIAKNITEHGNPGLVKIYGVPRGGITPAYMLRQALAAYHIQARVVQDIFTADVVIDDLIDSGTTKERYKVIHPDAPFYALFEKVQSDNDWYVFPWEAKEDEDEGLQGNVTRILQFVGEDVARPGLLETPKRVEKAWKEWTSGYDKDPADVMKVFADGAEGVDEMVVIKDIPFWSHCEHHMAPFFGTVDIAYIPNGRVLGLSKFKRLTDIFAHRLQVQERLTQDIATALMEHLNPVGAAVRVQARHSCMESRGVCTAGSTTVTSALKGAFKDDPKTRAEFYSLVN